MVPHFISSNPSYSVSILLSHIYFVLILSQLDGTAQVNFNGAASTTACSASKKLVGQASVATLNVSLGLVFNLTTNTVQITVTGKIFFFP